VKNRLILNNEIMIEKINKLVSASLQRAGVSKQVQAAIIADLMSEILREKFKTSTREMKVRHFKNETITISCTASVWAEEIRLAEPELLIEINARLNTAVVKKIIATS
jgi:predicted nucleic acid-binding Zn ribbon protein